MDTVQRMIHHLDDELDHENGHKEDSHEHDHDDHHHHHHGHSIRDANDAVKDIACSHDANIKSIMMECRGKVVDLDKLDEWLSELLWGDQYQDTDGLDENEEQKEDAET